MDLIIATTIAPFNIENQKKAMDTWIEAGFRVVSLNCADEIKILKPQFEKILFIEVDKDGRELFGRPYVFFDSFIEFFMKENVDICGIINSDIYFKDEVGSFREYIISEAEDSLVYASRINVESLKSSGKVYDFGFDMFFFDKKITCFYPKSNFCLGQPAWDYWITYLPIINGVNVKRLINSTGFHIIHPINWSTSNYDFFIKMLMQYKPAIQPVNTICDCNTYADTVLRYILDSSTNIFYNSNTEVSSKSVLILYSGDNYRNLIAALQQQTYTNFKVCNLDEFRKKDNFSDYVIAIEEDIQLENYYLQFMVQSINNKKYQYCGFKVLLDDIHFTNVYSNLSVSNYFFEREFFEELINKHNTLQEVNNYLLKGETVNENNLLGYGLVKTDVVKLVNNILSTINGNIFIYGAGGHTREIMKTGSLLHKRTVGIIDSNIELRGKEVNGKPIYSIEEINNLDIDYIIISSRSFENEIFNRLSSIIDSSKIKKIYSL